MNGWIDGWVDGWVFGWVDRDGDGDKVVFIIEENETVCEGEINIKKAYN